MPLLHRARHKSLLGESLKLHRAGQYDAATNGYEQLIDLGYHGHEPFFLLADIKRLKRDFNDALKYINKSLVRRPLDPDALLTKGLILEAINQGDLDESFRCYYQALELDPDSANLHYVLGAACSSQGNLQQAENYYRSTIYLDPVHSLAHFNLAYLLTLEESFTAAAQHYQLAMQADPEFLNAKSQYWHMRMKVCDWSDYAELEHVVNYELLPVSNDQSLSQPAFKEVFSPFTLINVLDDPHRLRAVAESFIQVLARNANANIALYKEVPPRLGANKPDTSLLKIGFMSADFCAHATSFLVAELFELMDRSRFEVHILSLGADDQSTLRRRIENSGCTFHDLEALTDFQVAEHISQLQIDVLLDLNGLTTGSRPDILGFRPAPVQINYLAYPGTMGADFIDYIIADSFVIPESLHSAYSEKIMYLPGCYQVNDRKRPIDPEIPSRLDCQLPEDALVLCCFNSNYKITPTIFAIWMEIMQEVPNSVLWLFKSHDQARTNLIERAAANGISASRIIFAEKRPIHEHLARIKNADLFLDTFPCNAHTTASDALWSGVPIVTLAGKSFASRVCGSLLKNVGLDELITTSYDHYKAVALALTKDRDRLQTIRATLENSVTDSELFNTEKYTRAFEHGLHHIAHRHLNGKKPETFFISTPEDPVLPVNSLFDSKDDNGLESTMDNIMEEHQLKINVTQIQPENSNYADSLQEFRETLLHAFALMEFECSELENDFIDDGLNVILGAHLLNSDDFQYVPTGSIFYNLELIGTDSCWSRPEFIELLNQYEIWDAHESNLARLKSLGVTSLAQHVPIGSVPELTRIPVAPMQDIDVLVCGKFTTLMQQSVEELLKEKLKVHVLDDLYGAQRDSFISRAKMILLPEQPTPQLNQAIIAYLLNNAKILISLSNQDNQLPTYLNELITSVNLSALASTCKQLALNDNNRHTQENLIQKTSINNHQAIYLHRALQTVGGQDQSIPDSQSSTTSVASPVPEANEKPDCTELSSGSLATPDDESLTLNFYAGDRGKPGCINCSMVSGYPADAILDPSSNTLLNSTLHTATYGDVTLTANQFDEIILDDVLAATHDLIATMTNCLHLLKPGGDLKISVPYDLSYAAWENPLNVRAFNERSWDIYTVNHTELGWSDACFSTSAMDVTFSPLGEELMANEHPIASVLAQPRAVDQLQVVLTKCTLPIHEQTTRIAA